MFIFGTIHKYIVIGRYATLRGPYIYALTSSKGYIRIILLKLFSTPSHLLK